MCTAYKANLHYTKIKLFLEDFSIIHVVYNIILGCGTSALMNKKNLAGYSAVRSTDELISFLSSTDELISFLNVTTSMLHSSDRTP